MAKKSYSEPTLPKKDAKMSKHGEMPTAQEVARRIEVELLKQGVPEGQAIKTAMSEASGLSETSIYKWFDGSTKRPDGMAAGAICQVYNLDTTWILFGGKHVSKKNEEESPIPAKPGLSGSSNDKLAGKVEDEFSELSPLMARIKKILLAANIHCAAVPATLAEICGLPLKTIRLWGTGKLAPQAEDLAAISRYYGIDLHWLIMGTISAQKPHGESINSEEFNSLGNVHSRLWRVAPCTN